MSDPAAEQLEWRWVRRNGGPWFPATLLTKPGIVPIWATVMDAVPFDYFEHHFEVGDSIPPPREKPGEPT